MLKERPADLSKFVEPDRVRKEVYTDAAIWEKEMENIHQAMWTYASHESQVPKTGDYYAVLIGRQPMILVRGKDRKVNVLYNRCPHRGNMMVGDTKGNTGEQFRCSYHAWTFHHDGASMGGGQIIGEVKAAGGLAQWRAGPVPAQNTMAPAGGHAWRVWTPAAAEAFKRISASAR